MESHEIIAQVMEDTALFEDSLPWYLKPCTEEEVERVSQMEDPIEFAAWVYNLVRRVEAAAAKYAQEEEPRVQAVAAVVKRLDSTISAMQLVVDGLEEKTPLEKAGKQYLLDRFEWALWILNERLTDWGY